MPGQFQTFSKAHIRSGKLLIKQPPEVRFSKNVTL